MARKNRNLPKPRGTRQGKKLTPVERETVRQVYLVNGNKTETARQLGLSLRSVQNVLKEDTTDPELKQARARAAVKMAGKVHSTAEKIIDSIGPTDIQAGHLRNDEGELQLDRQGRPIWLGPTLNQKVLSLAILADKLPVLEQYRAALEDDRAQGVLPLPEDIAGAISAVKGKLKSLSVLNIQFEDENAEMVERAKELLDKAERVSEEQDKAVDADYEVLDFDVPGKADNGEG